MLENFARFADRSGQSGPLTKRLAIRWASSTKGASRPYRARRLDLIRSFAQYQVIFEPKTQIPPRHVFGPARRRVTPYIYRPDEIQELMRRAAQLSGPLRGHTYCTLIGLLACTGLRVSEALRLTPKDIDLQEGVITVRESKHFKTRLVPLHASAIAPLRRYQRQRQRLFPLATAFFVSKSGAPLVLSTVDLTFSKLRHRIGDDQRRPRLYDLRHAFACRVLLRWQGSSRGAVGRVPLLSRYLGHTWVTDTYWYLSGVPELLAQAARSFSQYENQRS